MIAAADNNLDIITNVLSSTLKYEPISSVLNSCRLGRTVTNAAKKIVTATINPTMATIILHKNDISFNYKLHRISSAG